MKLSIVYLLVGALLIMLFVIIVFVILLLSSVQRYAEYWSKQNSSKVDNNTHPIVYVALGDSAAQGIGASSPSRGYVGIIADRLAKQSGRTVKIINLSKSGAKIVDVLNDQLPQLSALKPDVITIEIGGNDISSYNTMVFEQQFAELLTKLPPQTIVSDLPYFGGRTQLPFFGGGQAEKNVVSANATINKLAVQHGFELVKLHESTAQKNIYPWMYAIDYFHPNNFGYTTWADAFWARAQNIK